MKPLIMKRILPFGIGVLFLSLAVPIIGYASAITAPAWLQLLAGFPRAFLLTHRFIFIALPVMVLGVVMGSLLGRILQSRSAFPGVIASLPYLRGGVLQSVSAVSAVFSFGWVLECPTLGSALAGLIRDITASGGGNGTADRPGLAGQNGDVGGAMRGRGA